MRAVTHDLLYLASQSPRRRELLTQLGVSHELLLADDDEDAEALEAVLPGETPDAYVQRVCALKAEAALRRRERRALPDHPILTSDTTVCRGGDILGKPADPDDADEIRRYVASGEPLGKAGAYGIQGRAAEFVERIDGSYSGIMGLPLFETAALLREAGLRF